MPVPEPIEFELEGVVFGGRGRGRMLVRDLDTPGATIGTSDSNRPGGGVIAGRDHVGGQVWTFDLFSHGRTETDAREISQALAAVWRREYRPMETVALQLRTAHGAWRVYGRPRRWVPPKQGVAFMAGRADVVCEFHVTDSRYFEDPLQGSGELSGVGQQVGGIVFPLKFPLATLTTSQTSGRFITVGGDAPAPLAVRFSGPAVNPRVWTPDGRIDVRLRGALDRGQQVTVDARQGTVLRNDGASVPGMLAPRTRMSDLVLPPGRHELLFTAAAEATVTVAWRNVRRSI